MKYLSNQEEKSLNRQDHLCTSQSSPSPKSWQLHFLLIYCVPSTTFLFLSFPLPLNPITHQSDRVHFSPLRGWMKIKSKATWSTRGITCFDSWWLGVWCFSAACLLGRLPARLPVCSFPSPSNGELQSARSDTVKPSGMADYGAKYWSLPHMCQNSPHPLIRISPSRHTGTNRIY